MIGISSVFSSEIAILLTTRPSVVIQTKAIQNDLGDFAAGMNDVSGCRVAAEARLSGQPRWFGIAQRPVTCQKSCFSNSSEI